MWDRGFCQLQAMRAGYSCPGATHGLFFGRLSLVLPWAGTYGKESQTSSSTDQSSQDQRIRW